MTDSASLYGKAAIVFGASRGIGEQISRSLAAAGASVMLASRDEDSLRSISQEIEGNGGTAAWVRADMSDTASIAAAVAVTVERFGKLDVAVNNAGVQVPRTPITEISDEVFDHIIGVNLRGVFAAMRHETKAMLEAGGGSIVNISSAAGIVGIPFIAPYVASKHGVIGLTKSAAIELAKQGVRVNAVVPGAVMTDILRIGPASSEQALQMTLNMIPMGRLGTTDEIANAVVWLASDQASYVTGAALPVDGALTVP